MKKIQLFKAAITMALVFGLTGCEQPDKDSVVGAVFDGSLSLNESVTVGGATVSAVTVSGSTGSPLPTAATLTILLDTDEFDVPAATTVTSWFTNLPTGLSAVSASGSSSNSIAITISGTPNVGSAQVMAITIPNAVLFLGGGDITVTRNPAAKYDIIQLIGNAADMAVFASAVANGDGAQKGTLTASVNLGSAFTPIGVLVSGGVVSSTTPYSGVFDGGGNKITISGFDSASLDGAYAGLFGYVSAGTVSNLVVDATATGASPVQLSARYMGAVTGLADSNALFQGITTSGSLSLTSNLQTFTGGIAGSIRTGTTIRDSSSSVDVAANGGLDYFADAGGITGYAGYQAMVSGCVASGSVTATGGMNTSAGGLVGYVENSTVENSSALGTVTMLADRTAPVTRAFAGGLAGSSYGGTILRSNARGGVSGRSGNPYVGGLVGRSSRATGISESYASGNVTAETIYNSSSSIPYAGGIAGYNGEAGGLIENCYATGNVSALTLGNTIWAGGISGTNLDGATVSKCYSTGSVTITITSDPSAPGASSGAMAGGISGYNQETGVVENSAALNRTITGNTSSAAQLHRVAGRNEGIISNNIANEGMTVTPTPTWDKGPDGLDGADAAAQPAQQVYVGTLGWDFSKIWIMGANYPALVNNP